MCMLDSWSRFDRLVIVLAVIPTALALFFTIVLVEGQLWPTYILYEAAYMVSILGCGLSYSNRSGPPARFQTREYYVQEEDQS